MEQELYVSYLNSVTNNGKILRTIPDRYKTYELCLAAVKNYGLSLQYVPTEHKSYEMCLEAVKKTGWALVYVLSEHIDSNICLEASRSGVLAAINIPQEIQSIEFWNNAVQNYGFNSLFVPNEYKNN